MALLKPADVVAASSSGKQSDLIKRSGTLVKPPSGQVSPPPGGVSRGGTTPNYTPPSTPSPAPAAAPAAQAAPTGGQETIADMLTKAISAIEAEYGMTREQLLSDESEIGRQYRLLVAEAQRQGVDAARALESSVLDRGLVQSGIYADQAAQLQQAQAEQVAALRAQEAAALGDLAAQRAALPAQQAAAQAAAAQQAAQAGLDLDLVKAAASGGI